MDDEYSKAYQELDANDQKTEVKDAETVKTSKPKAVPKKEAVEAEVMTEAQAFAEAWNEAA